MSGLKMQLSLLNVLSSFLDMLKLAMNVQSADLKKLDQELQAKLNALITSFRTATMVGRNESISFCQSARLIPSSAA